MKTFQEKLNSYAELAVKVGVNIQPNQYLFIQATVDNVEFVRLVTKKAYEAGAREVFVHYSDDVLTRMHYEFAPEDAFEFFAPWHAEEKNWLADHGAAFMTIKSQSPDLLKGIHSNHIAKQQKASGQALSHFRQATQSNKVSWTVIGAPSPDWAAKVYPNLSKDEQVPALWEAIFKTVRADLDDPLKAWEKHDTTLHEKVNYLNNKKYHKLHYTAPGTDLIIELPKEHIWSGGGSVNQSGKAFMANIPTEEVFTAPFKEGVNGYVSCTKPLSYGGNIIDHFTITFENGRIVKIEAQEGEEVLKNLVASDEGSHYLGEVALVPNQSPISASGLLFYNTLFDENASNHLAIGSAYAFCIENGTNMTQEELLNNGLNRSIAHVDFMVGSGEMNIDGITEDGKVEAVFRNGNWAF
ncbi:aminopeptidase [Rummeliibacillus pycnus]|uniref:aminopeptidase n=1 Tax=Rummeliibacillus pycnus TaxID=101070 RepID=UPI000C9AAE37|nr:aminopeptidase [Rummeliibacillus pycnus]